MAQGMDRSVFLYAGPIDSQLHRPLDDRIADMMPPDGAALRIDGSGCGWKNILPGLFLRGSGILPGKGIRQPDRSEALGKILDVQIDHPCDMDLQLRGQGSNLLTQWTSYLSFPETIILLSSKNRPNSDV